MGDSLILIFLNCIFLIIYYTFDSDTSSFLSVRSKTEGFLCLCVDGKKDPYVAFEDDKVKYISQIQFHKK